MRKAVCGLIAASILLTPKPAAALSLGPLDTLVNVVTARLGVGISNKLNQYLTLGLGRLDKLIGVDPGTISGAMGITDPLKAAQSIDNKLSGIKPNDLAIPVTVQGTLDKGRFNTGLAQAIGSSVLSTDAQSALKQASEATAEAVQASSKLSQKAQSLNVTQDIAKIQTQQAAQTIGVLNTINQKADLELQQSAATTLNTATTAQHANAEEQRAAEDAAAGTAYTIQQSGMQAGIIEAIGR